MQTSVLITNGGPHSAEKWAECTASHLIQIGDHVSGEQLAGARKLELAILNILEGHHETVQSGETALLTGLKAKDVGARLAVAPDAGEHLDVDAAVGEVVAAAAGTDFEPHFALPKTQAYIRAVLTQHFNTNIDIARQWHADTLAGA